MGSNPIRTTKLKKNNDMYTGTVIYLFDEDLSLKGETKRFEEINFSDFSYLTFSRDKMNKADLVIYRSDKFGADITIKSRF